MKPAFFRDGYVRMTGIGFLALCIVSFFLALTIQPGEGVLVIHFTSDGGLDFFGSRMHVFGIVGAGFMAALVNACLAYFFYDRINFFSLLLVFFNVFIGILILIAVGVILTVN